MRLKSASENSGRRSSKPRKTLRSSLRSLTDTNQRKNENTPGSSEKSWVRLLQYWTGAIKTIRRCLCAQTESALKKNQIPHKQTTQKQKRTKKLPDASNSVQQCWKGLHLDLTKARTQRNSNQHFPHSGQQNQSSHRPNTSYGHSRTNRKKLCTKWLRSSMGSHEDQRDLKSFEVAYQTRRQQYQTSPLL